MSGGHEHRSTLGHIRGLDGLRGVAVAAVLLFHDGGRLRGGYLGVDLFFVLSGFLITSILLSEWERSKRIDLRRFWVRRARRLLPALLSLMPAIAIYAQTIAAKSERASLRADALATLGYVANWRAIFAKRSYWEMFAAPSPLEHTWSLAIEEQFYIVWPLLVFLVLRFAKNRRLALLATSLALASASMLAMFLLADGEGGARVYLGTDTRGAAILLGSALAASGWARESTGSSRFQSILDSLGWLSIAALGWAWLELDGENPFLYRGGFWLCEIGNLIVIACCVRIPGGVVSRIFSLAPLRALGVISYGVYLWHWPIYVVVDRERTHLAGLTLLALRIAITLGIAIASYFFLEKPIREHGLRWGRPLVIVPSGFALAAFCILASTRTVDAEPGKTGGSAIAGPISSSSSLPEEIKFPPVDMFPPPQELPPNAVRLLVLGDSVAMSLGSRMYWVRHPEDPFVVSRAIGDCSILDGMGGIAGVHSLSGARHGNGNCARNWVDDVTELRPDITLVLLGGAFFSTAKISGSWRMVCENSWGDAYVEKLRTLLTSIAPFSKRRIVLSAPTPVGKWEAQPGLAEKVGCYNRILEAAAKKSGAEILDLAAYICPSAGCTLESDGEPVRFDGLHFGATGADRTVRWVFDSIREFRTPSSDDKMFDAGSQSAPRP